MHCPITKSLLHKINVHVMMSNHTTNLNLYGSKGTRKSLFCDQDNTYIHTYIHTYLIDRSP